MFSNLVMAFLVVLVVVLIVKVRGMAQDIETLFNMVRAAQGIPPRPGSKAPQPDAIDHARAAVAQHESQFHKR